MKRITLAFLLCLPGLLSAQIYKTTDSQGNVTFTDRPPATSQASEQVDIQQTNTSAPPPTIIRPEPSQPAPAPAATQYQLAIVSPANETTIAMGPGNFSISASVDPLPDNGDSLQLLIDGTPWDEPQTGTTWAVTNVFRGAHDITISALSESGDVITTSGPVRVYVLRPSIHNRRP
ncbi:MAG: DUF4124 domain-containing protein [Halioglobus sp.]